MAEAERGNMADVVVVYEQQEHYVQAAGEPNEGINVDLLQCQILSLVGLLPEEQILVSSRGEVIASPFPNASLALASLPVSPEGTRERVFVVRADVARGADQRVPADWREICTRCTFGDLPLVQPAFRAIGGGDTDQLVCGACATTCSTDAAMVTPLDWRSSKKLAARFISELLVIAGEADVPTPPGFSKVAGDLNYSASGDYVHLFVKRGGGVAVTQVSVVHQQRAEKKGQHSRTKGQVYLPVDCNSGNESDVAVFLSYEVISSSQNESMYHYAITDVDLIVGDAAVPGGWIKIPSNLNEGCVGSEPIYLSYKLSPLGGFACATAHGAFGECLFQSRHSSGVPLRAVVPAGWSPQSDGVLSSLDSARQRADSSFLENHYRQYESGMRSRLLGGMERVKSYENPLVQAEALKRIPVTTLHERARANPTPLPSYQDELVMQLTHWFKREFFSWMNQPKCSVCSFEKTQIVRSDPPATPEEVAGEASRVEVYQCSQCRGFTRFPRYNNPVKLLDTRTGRCGEWANCFTLCCRAMGFEARYVLDVTDHVWTEVYSEHHKRWLHCDSCEDQLDRPLTYEVGWGKKLSYIFSFSHEEVVDTAQRYTQNWDDMKLRRSEVSEVWLASTIQQMNQTLRQHISPDRARILDERAIRERAEFVQSRTATAEEVQGRVSGSDEWKSQRNEDGQSTDHSVSSGLQGVNSNHDASGPLPSVGDLIQSVVKTMLLGCDRGSSCNNPICMHKRSLQTPGASATDRAAQALQDAAEIQGKNFSSQGLASLLCPSLGGIQDFILSHQVEAYWPLQDSKTNGSSSTLVDVSGRGHHGQSTAPLRKPFRIPAPNGDLKLAFGLQLLPERRLAVPIPKMDSFVVSWLARFDPTSIEVSRGGIALSLQLGDDGRSAAVLVRRELGKEALVIEVSAGGGEVVNSTPTVRLGLYYHFAVAIDSDSVTVFVNAKEVVRAHASTGSMINKEQSTMIFQSPAVGKESKHQSAVVAVLCHVAVLTECDEHSIQKFNEAVNERFVCRPLQAYNAVGVRPDKICNQPEAALQSGYRICRVKMWGGEFLDGIQLIYEKTDGGTTVTVEGPLVGNRVARDAIRSPTVEFALFPNEHLVGLSGRKGAWTDCVSVRTNFGRLLTCGGSGGVDFKIDLPSNSGHTVQIRAIQFDVGDHLVDAVAFVGELPSSTDDETLTKLRQILEIVDGTKRTGAIGAVIRYLENIVASPQDPKFQKIRASNKFFTSNVGVLAPNEQKAFMEWCGFGGIVEAGETFYVFQPKTSAGISKGDVAAMRLHYLKAFLTSK